MVPYVKKIKKYMSVGTNSTNKLIDELHPVPYNNVVDCRLLPLHYSRFTGLAIGIPEQIFVAALLDL